MVSVVLLPTLTREELLVKYIFMLTTLILTIFPDTN